MKRKVRRKNFSPFLYGLLFRDASIDSVVALSFAKIKKEIAMKTWPSLLISAAICVANPSQGIDVEGVTKGVGISSTYEIAVFTNDEVNATVSKGTLYAAATGEKTSELMLPSRSPISAVSEVWQDKMAVVFDDGLLALWDFQKKRFTKTHSLLYDDQTTSISKIMWVDHFCSKALLLMPMWESTGILWDVFGNSENDTSEIYSMDLGKEVTPLIGAWGSGSKGRNFMLVKGARSSELHLDLLYEGFGINGVSLHWERLPIVRYNRLIMDPKTIVNTYAASRSDLVLGFSDHSIHLFEFNAADWIGYMPAGHWKIPLPTGSEDTEKLSDIHLVVGGKAKFAIVQSGFNLWLVTLKNSGATPVPPLLLDKSWGHFMGSFGHNKVVFRQHPDSGNLSIATLRVVDLVTLTVTKGPKTFENFQGWSTFSPDGRFLIDFSSYEGTGVNVWDLNSD